jgi:hypothetical protein
VPTSDALAAQLVVDCSGQTPGAFTSITSAIDSLTGPPPAAEDWDYVLLKSDCTENVTISGGLRLWIAPEWDPWPWSWSTTNGPLARIAAADAGQGVVTVLGSADVTLVHLALANGFNGLEMGGTASVDAYGVVAEDNSNAGFIVNTGGSLTVSEGGAYHNGSYGFRINLGASVSAAGSLSWLQGQPLVIRENQDGGVRVDRGRFVAWNGFRIEDNLGPGLTAYSGVASFADYQADSPALIHGNQGGAFISEGSRISFGGSVVVRNNGAYGVYLEDGGHASFIALGPEPEQAVQIEGHTTVGVDVAVNSQAAFHGQHRIRQNGSVSDPTSAGVRVDGSSHVILDIGNGDYTGGPPQVVDNAGPGISVDLNSGLDARAAIFRNNAGGGVRVLHKSVAYLGPDCRVRPNSGPPVICDSTSLVVTSLVHRRRACRQVERPTVPRPERPPMPQ